ncbi:hypothetical protein K493DRAFT_307496 [Basidiobolus meristosporus CBS 931.73]|uniref:Uncharacterized protein n=1 Tax=Basidiobolus meristosporus CBS 931.73 TaxID=1314790 RepID=A0A1Y1XFA8_9FUNG|nr:hypothetical protein K493DRAFT_307496 [Basidiobolus meristosporus CBS 931.73]|eukprot:ORX84054.1 hypothetical protein K493DRAFT_307496 [Basidiobolus meristosporus CBS 931.73]
MVDLGLNGTAFAAHSILVLLLTSILHAIHLDKRIVMAMTYLSSRPMDSTISDYALAIRYPLCAVRYYITQLVDIDLIKTSRKPLKIVMQSIFEGSAIWVNPLALRGIKSVASSHEIDDREPKFYKKRTLSLIVRPDNRITIKHGPWEQVNAGSVSLLVESKLSASHMLETKLTYYLRRIGCLCVTSYLIHGIYAIIQSLRNFGYIPGAHKIMGLISPFLFVPFLCNTSVFQAPVLVTVEVDDCSVHNQGQGSNSSKTEESSKMDSSTQRAMLIRYRIQQLVGSLLFMSLYYAVFSLTLSLSAMDNDSDAISHDKQSYIKDNYYKYSQCSPAWLTVIEYLLVDIVEWS